MWIAQILDLMSLLSHMCLVSIKSFLGNLAQYSYTVLDHVVFPFCLLLKARRGRAPFKWIICHITPWVIWDFWSVVCVCMDADHARKSTRSWTFSLLLWPVWMCVRKHFLLVTPARGQRRQAADTEPHFSLVFTSTDTWKFGNACVCFSVTCQNI